MVAAIVTVAIVTFGIACALLGTAPALHPEVIPAKVGQAPRSARSAARRTLPASSRIGSSVYSSDRGTL